MDVKKIVLLIGALVVAVMTAMMARSIFGGSMTPPPAEATVVVPAEPVGPEVLVATRSLPVGTILGPDAFRYQPWPKDLIGNAYYIRGQGADAQKLIGTVVRTEITAGQPLTQGALVPPGDRGFLAAALGPGMRAVSLPVSAQTGVSGFIFPGDRVDLMLTQEVKANDGSASLKVSETVIRNLRVLAADQHTDKVVDAEGKTSAQTVSTVTVEATPRIAEKITVAQTVGTLSLALRPLADNTGELERAIAAGEVSVPDGKDPKVERQMLIAIASKPQDNDTTYTVGADVSRFQRRGMPSLGPPPAPVAAPSPAAAGPTVSSGGRSLGVRVARGNSVTAAMAGGVN